ncbi:MAG TPA: hypothetical protein VFN35_35965, partial [Ktedonobacteraceae bacterium]|nr:hypothetical protein [Ktedonobacteraceae bacterium]
ASLQSPNNVRQIVLQALAADWDTASIQVVFALRPGQKYFLASYLPPLALQKLAISPSWEIRFLVAHHAQTPLKIRQLLSRDGNRYVRAMARVKTGMTQPEIRC